MTQRPCRRPSIALCLTLVTALLAGCSGGSSSSSSTGGGNPTPAVHNQWTWIGGNMQFTNPSSVYGTQGVAATTNVPGSRSGAVAWTDTSGNLWLFGGGRFDPLGTEGPRNDLWKYAQSSKEWTWVSGSSTVPANHTAIYGTQGAPAAANVPGGRAESVSWTDTSGNLWLFGGQGYDATGRDNYLNDLWQFNPTTGQWTWISGSNRVIGPANYGTLGVASATSVPGARSNGVSWTDHAGNLWLFGGAGFDASLNYGSFNDLWEFSPSTKQWAWIAGSDTVGPTGVYGTLGQPAAANVPGARFNAVSWTDANGNLWLFGGLVNSLTGGSDRNDLWEFSIAAKQWAWISGSSADPGSSTCLAGTYGTKGAAAATNTPGGRNAASSWVDASGNLWLFGGLGCDAGGTAGSLNDLWEFNIAAKTWTWQAGSNSVGPPQGGTGGPSGVYGTQGTPSAANTPGGREGALAWTGTSGQLYLFGGSGYYASGSQTVLNDLWTYTP